MNILYVEDNKANAYLIKLMLKEYDVDLAYTAGEALRLLENQTYHVIFIDINLGNDEMDGIELLKIIRSLPGHSKVPICTITAYAMAADRKRFLDAGFDQYFSKPLDRKSFLKSVALFAP
jgi:CheY-like chemotaxis protein